MDSGEMASQAVLQMFLSVPLVLEETSQVTAIPHTGALGNLQMGCYMKYLSLGGHASWYYQQTVFTLEVQEFSLFVLK